MAAPQGESCITACYDGVLQASNQPVLWFSCFPERKHSAPVHHTTEHVPEKKFKSEALLSTLTSDASKENTPGNCPTLPAAVRVV